MVHYQNYRKIWKGGRGVEQVLLQWQGADPEDSSWESMEEVRSVYPSINLEDKVGFVGEGDDMMVDNSGLTGDVLKVAEEADDEKSGDLEFKKRNGAREESDDESSAPNRPTRRTQAPGWTRDFVMGRA